MPKTLQSEHYYRVLAIRARYILKLWQLRWSAGESYASLLDPRPAKGMLDGIVRKRLIVPLLRLDQWDEHDGLMFLIVQMLTTMLAPL